MWQYLFELKKIKIKEFVTEYFIFRKNVLHFAEEKREKKTAVQEWKLENANN
jgi:hypothetical protein